MSIFNKIQIRIICIFKYIKKYKTIRRDHNRKIVFFNTPEHDNLGDQALTCAELIFVKDNIPDLPCYEVTGSEMLGAIFGLGGLIQKNDIIAIHAGGYLGTIWFFGGEQRCRKILKTYKHNKIIIFPQTVYYSDDEFGNSELKKSKSIYSECDNLTIFVREKFSYDFLKEHFRECNVKLVPDMVLYFQKYNKCYLRKGVLLCLRKDHEKTSDSFEAFAECLKHKNMDYEYTDTTIEKHVPPQNREKELREKLDEFSHAELVITDRMHGMVFSAITGTPCVVLKSLSYKTEGVYDWISDVKSIKMIQDLSELDNAINEVLLNKDSIYEPKKLRYYFEPLIKEVKDSI